MEGNLAQLSSNRVGLEQLSGSQAGKVPGPLGISLGHNCVVLQGDQKKSRVLFLGISRGGFT